MKCAALGVRMHSGWGLLVAVSGDAGGIAIMDRRRIVTTDSRSPGANQPYHYASRMGVQKAEAYLVDCASISERAAATAISSVVEELGARGYRIVGAAVLLASGRPLPSLEKILAAHPLIHTAEGEFFRDAVRKACEGLKICVTALRERELEDQAKRVFGNAAARVQRTISSHGRLIGPPWTKDHKSAALAASVILAGKQGVVVSRAARKSTR